MKITDHAVDRYRERIADHGDATRDVMLSALRAAKPKHLAKVGRKNTVYVPTDTCIFIFGEGGNMVTVLERNRVMNADDILDGEFRKSGFTGNARNFPMSDGACEVLAEFNGAKIGQMPRTWRFAPNKACLEWMEWLAGEKAAGRPIWDGDKLRRPE